MSKHLDLPENRVTKSEAIIILIQETGRSAGTWEQLLRTYKPDLDKQVMANQQGQPVTYDRDKVLQFCNELNNK